MSPDRRQHRGAHPADAELFAPARLDSLRTAVGELSWLLGRGYAVRSAVKLVGDRHALDERQRLAVSRAACSDEACARRTATLLAPEEMRGAPLIIDGFNLLITLEAALGGGVLLLCRDATLRDLSSVHGSYRSVEETERALDVAGQLLATLAPESVEWIFDRPISNSGRLAARVRELAAHRSWPWTVELVFNPDAALRASEKIVVTSDAIILDHAARWINLGYHLVRQYLHHSWIVDLSV